MIRWIVGLILLWGIFIQHPPTDKTSYNAYKKVLKANRLTPNIHYGGCGWFAMYLYESFERKGIESKIIFCGEGDIPKHIFVKNKYGYWDNKGIFTNFAAMLWFGGKLSEKTPQELQHSLKQSGWNTKFNLKDTTLIKTIL